MATRIIEVEAGTPRRRNRSDDEKARIVSEAMASGSIAAEIARRHGICTSLLYRWRRKLLAEQLAPVTALPAPERPGFVPVKVADEVAATPAGVVELVMPGGARVRLVPPIDPRVLKAVLAALT